MQKVTAFKANDGKLYDTMQAAIEADASITLFSLFNDGSLFAIVQDIIKNKATRDKLQTVLDTLDDSSRGSWEDIVKQFNQFFSIDGLYYELLSDETLRCTLHQLLRTISRYYSKSNKVGKR